MPRTSRSSEIFFSKKSNFPRGEFLNELYGLLTRQSVKKMEQSQEGKFKFRNCSAAFVKMLIDLKGKLLH